MARTQTPIAVTPTTLVEGRATLEGTKRFRKRFTKTHGDHFYRELANGPLVSSLGLGTYLGECDDTEDARYTAAAGAALEKGVNLLDTAINYRCQRSERAVGEAIRNAIAMRAIKREEVVVCTKGGYIPLEKIRNFWMIRSNAVEITSGSTALMSTTCTILNSSWKSWVDQDSTP